MSNLIQETLTRRVPQTLFVYLGVCWALIEVSAFIEERFALGRWLADTVMITLICGLLSVVVLAWNHGKRGPDPWRRPELVFHGVVAALIVALVGWRIGTELHDASTLVSSRAEVPPTIPPDAGTTPGSTSDSTPEKTDDAALEEAILATLPEPEPPSEYRCVWLDVVESPGSGEAWDESRQWVPRAVEFGVARMLGMRSGVSVQRGSRVLSRLRHDHGIAPGSPLPTALLLQKSVHRGCENVVSLEIRRAEKTGLRANTTLYRRDEHEQPQRMTAGPLELIPLVESVSDQLVEGLGLPQDPPLPRLATIVSASERVIELLIREALLPESAGQKARLRLLEEAIEQDPTCVDVMMRLAALVYKVNDFDDTLRWIPRIQAQLYRLPPDARWKTQADLMRWQGKYQVARRIVALRAEQFPRDMEAQKQHVFYLWKREERYQEAADVLEKALKVDPAHPELLDSLQTVLSLQERWDELESLLLGRIKDQPQHVGLREQYARFLSEQGRLDDLRAVYEEIVAIEPDQRRHLWSLISLDIREGHFEKAAFALDLWEAQYGGESRKDVNATRALIALNTGRPRECIAFSRRSMADRKGGPSGPALNILADLPLFINLLDAGAEEQARAILVAHEAYEGSERELAARYRLRWARYKEDADGLNATLAELDAAMDARDVPREYESWLLPFRVAEQRLRGNFEAALALLDSDRLGRTAPGNLTVRSKERMQCLLGLRRFSDAEVLARALLKRSPADAKMYTWLAKALDGAKKPREAREAYRRALELWANAEDDYKPMLDARAALLELTARSE